MMARRPTLLLATLLLALLAQAALRPAAAAAQVVVLRVDPAAESLCEMLEGALSDFGLIADPGHFAEAQRRGLDPSGDEALATLTPLLNVQLAVVPQSANPTAALVEFRDGRSGASLGTASIPLDDGGLSSKGRDVLRAEVAQRLGLAPQGGAPPPVQPEPVPGAPGGQASPAVEEASGSEPDALRMRVYGGAGMGTRTLEWPMAGERIAVETGAYAAVELGASLAFALGESVTLGPEFNYQTSLDHEITEMHVAGVPETMGIRSHHFDALLVPTFHFGADNGWYLAPAFGYGVRNLRPDVHHLLTPSSSIAGPLVRLELRIAFGASVGLRLAPEAQWVLVGDELEELGIESSGLGFGGNAALEIAISDAIWIELTYREAHASLPSSQGDDATDVERYVTARLRGEL